LRRGDSFEEITDMFKYIILFFTIFLFFGCAPSPNTVVKPDKNTLRFDTSETVDKVITNHKICFNKYKKLLVIKSEIKNYKYVNFIATCLRNINVFDAVMTPEELELYIVKNGLSSKVDNINNFIGLRKLYEQIGEFLIIDMDDIHKPPGLLYEGNLKVYDPKNGDLLFHSFHKTFIWNRMDKPMLFPLINSFIDWLEENQE
jgi:hypothetical protein